MNRITPVFTQLDNHKLLSVYLTAGYPRLEYSVELLLTIARSGADILEVGIPFSDPLADGPTIQQASQRALEQGVTVPKVLGILRQVREKTDIPLIVMGYINPILRFGLANFLSELARSGGDGLIIPDLPPEEATELVSFARANNLSAIFLVSPNTSIERMRRIDELSTDFVYCVSIKGVTGARKELPSHLVSYLKRVRQTLHKPFLVGFGISTPEVAHQISRYSDGVIVGSAVIDIINNTEDFAKMQHGVGEFVRRLKEAL